MAPIETKLLEKGYVQLGRAAKTLARDHGGATINQAVNNFRK